jgi:Tol biopolymer transport system component
LPFWSPDGTKLGYFQGGKLWTTDVRGGSPISLADAPNSRGATWGSGGVILFAAGSSDPILRISANGGATSEVTPRPKQSFESCRWPFFLPDGKHFLYLWAPNGSGHERNEVHFASLDGSGDKVLLTGYYYSPRYAAGWLLVALHGTLMAQRLDPSSGTLSGEVLQVSDRAGFDDLVASSVFSASENGLLVYEEVGGKGGEHHILVDGNGKLIREISEPDIYGGSRISPDSTKVAVPVGGSGQSEVWIWNLLAGTRARLTLNAGLTDQAMWSPDARTVYFSYSHDNRPIQIYRKPADGSGEQELVIRTEHESWPEETSSDGKWLLYAEGGGGNRRR